MLVYRGYVGKHSASIFDVHRLLDSCPYTNTDSIYTYIQTVFTCIYSIYTPGSCLSPNPKKTRNYWKIQVFFAVSKNFLATMQCIA